jgi:hypothetical protein
MSFIDPEFNFKNKLRKIKTRAFIILKKEYINDNSKQHCPFLK